MAFRSPAPVATVDRAYARLEQIEAACSTFREDSDLFIFAGGDVVARSSGVPWRVGIQHPRQRDATAVTLFVTDGAVPTSGIYER